jgi:hypothetical protein
MDLIALSGLIIAILSATGTFLSHLHLKKVKLLGCVESECRQGKTEPNTPTTTEI